MALIVTKPGGLKWEGVLYETGAPLPPDVAREVVQHPNYPALVAAGYVAADGSYEALSRGLSRFKDDIALARAVAEETEIELDLEAEEEDRGPRGKARR